jgi:cytochrome c
MNTAKNCMVKVLACAWISGALLGASPAQSAEQEGAKLFEQARCYICHDTDKNSLGPPLKAIAARHAARKDVMTDVLARKIVVGGGGSWGLVPMVPNQWVSIEQARVISAWILGGK